MNAARPHLAPAAMIARRWALAATLAESAPLAGVSDAARAALCAAPRMRDRLAMLEARRLGLDALTAEMLERPAARLCAIGRDAVAAFSIRVGVAWRAAAAAAVLRADDVATLTDALGFDPRPVAAAWRDWGDAERPRIAPAPVDMIAFAADITEQGRQCVSAFAATEPQPLARVLTALAEAPAAVSETQTLWARADLCAAMAAAEVAPTAQRDPAARDLTAPPDPKDQTS